MQRPKQLNIEAVFTMLILLTLEAPGFTQVLPKVPADGPAYEKERNSIRNTRTREMHEWWYNVYDGRVTRERYKIRIVKINEQGNISETIVLDRGGERKSITLFSYNSANLPFREDEYLPEGFLLGKTEYHYDSAGYLGEIIWYHGADFIIGKTLFTHSATENLLVERQMFSPDSVSKKIVYRYSHLETGRIMNVLTFSGEDRLESLTEYFYNEEGLLSHTKWSDPEDHLMYTVEFYYNPDGRLRDTYKLFPDGEKILISTRNYSDLLLLTGEVNYSDKGEVLNYRKFTYK